jgi:uncharacterized membrane protein YhaH (DUF805 family)
MEGQEVLLVAFYLAIYLAVICIPIAKVLSRVGFSGWWSLLAVVPLVGLIMLWVFAFIQWPRDREVG